MSRLEEMSDAYSSNGGDEAAKARATLSESVFKLGQGTFKPYDLAATVGVGEGHSTAPAPASEGHVSSTPAPAPVGHEAPAATATGQGEGEGKSPVGHVVGHISVSPPAGHPSDTGQSGCGKENQCGPDLGAAVGNFAQNLLSKLLPHPEAPPQPKEQALVPHGEPLKLEPAAHCHQYHHIGRHLQEAAEHRHYRACKTKS
jgi:hypothetical protein